MKKFKVTMVATKEFEIPDNATDEEYDEMKAIVVAGFQANPCEGEIKVELIDAPDEIKAKYIYNKDCD